MKILVVGSGGREHALVWKLRQSPLVSKIYAAPGNGGTSSLAENVDIAATDISGLLSFAERKAIDLTVVGPEAPLVQGIVDQFSRRGLSCFGPSREAAKIEGSKAYAKTLMQKYGIPTGRFDTFKDREKAVDYVERLGTPLVIKASGLAAGKGSITVRDHATAIETIDSMLLKKAFGDAGAEIVIEEYLEGEETSMIALTDGETVVPLLPSQDHKRILDNDAGPNTGGMGAYAPVPFLDRDVSREIEEQCLRPVIRALREENVSYRGVLYAGLMLTDRGPKVLEYNCRLGDPETQPVLPLLKSDLADLIQATMEGTLKTRRIEWLPRYAACVVLVSGGYPGAYEKDKRIEGIERAEAIDGVVVFHAGTKKVGKGFVTNGGRILGVTGVGERLGDAIEKAYQGVDTIRFEKMHYRRDIGRKGLRNREIGR